MIGIVQSQSNWPWYKQIFDEVSFFAFGPVCHLYLHYCMMEGNLAGTKLLCIVYLKNSMKIMRAGRWELKSSRISILQLPQKDRAIKQRGISRMPGLSVNKTGLWDSLGFQFSANYSLTRMVMQTQSDIWPYKKGSKESELLLKMLQPWWLLEITR